jgi:cyanophycin synthetase
VYFAFGDKSPLVGKHTASGHAAYFTRGGWIIEACGDSERELVEFADLPLTAGGIAKFQVYNLLAAVAACRALELPASVIRERIRTFDSAVHNSGRANLYRVEAGYAMIDYGHNPAAFEAVCRMAADWTDRRITGVIGVPGDRCDALIEEAGRAAARGFHRILIKEDSDLRGRQPGEVSAILERAIRKERPDVDVDVVHNEREAVLTGLHGMQQDELLVVFCEDPEVTAALLAEHGATPVEGMEVELSTQILTA